MTKTTKARLTHRVSVADDLLKAAEDLVFQIQCLRGESTVIDYDLEQGKPYRDIRAAIAKARAGIGVNWQLLFRMRCLPQFAFQIANEVRYLWPRRCNLGLITVQYKRRNGAAGRQ